MAGRFFKLAGSGAVPMFERFVFHYEWPYSTS
jgi:hypothetical protein